MESALGTVGMVMLLGAFLANAAGRLAANGRLYPALNLLGAGLLAWYSAILGVWIFVILESVWAIAALWNLARAVRRGQAPEADQSSIEGAAARDRGRAE